MNFRLIHISIILSLLVVKSSAQISPGDLAKEHAELEGIMNCTQCHVLGGKVSDDKCLQCHQEIESRINRNQGYHASKEIKAKQCADCHSDHHGRNFQLVRFDEQNFKHDLAGYKLTGQHQKIDCRECHQPDLIADSKLKRNKDTFLGLGTECLSCHDDYHQKTLSKDCASCHNTSEFSPAPKFDHSETEFALRGKHLDVECVDCHPMETRNGQQFQKFTDIPFGQCIDCHEDPHENKFGPSCADCHKEESFSVPKSLAYFDHDKTGYALSGRHRRVDCKQCHTTKFTDPVAHHSCVSCHRDYHRGEFASNGRSPDCAECHNVNGFEVSLYTIEDHNKSDFPLEEAHLATPCNACHQTDDRWSFRGIGEDCVDCHQDIHAGYIDEKYYPDQSCTSCHLVSTWKDHVFDHGLTSFELSGTHAEQECMACHGTDNPEAHKFENFQNLSNSCYSCHEDIHNQQFMEDGITDCARCHGFEDWQIDRFNHKNTAFKLEGKHAQVECASCHKEVVDNNLVFVQYKFKSFECIDCHQ